MKKNLIYDDYTASKRQENSMNLQSAGSEQHPLPEGGEPEEGCYYLPQSTDFPEIDSFLLVHPPDEPSPILFMFRIAPNQSEHDVSANGLRNVDDLEFPSNARRCYVMVTPEHIWSKIMIPMENFEVQQILSDTFLVFHFPICTKELFTD